MAADAMTPRRTSAKPLSASQAASSSVKPKAAGSQGADFTTSSTPWGRRTRPAASVSQRPAWPTGHTGAAAVADSDGPSLLPPEPVAGPDELQPATSTPVTRAQATSTAP